MAFGLREYFAIRIAAGTMKRKVIAAMTPWPLIIWWYWGSEANLLPIPIHCASTSASIHSIVSVLQIGRKGRGGGRGQQTIVSHRLEIQAHQIRQQEIIASRIPRSVSNIHGVRAVCAAPGRREVVLGCHCCCEGALLRRSPTSASGSSGQFFVRTPRSHKVLC